MRARDVPWIHAPWMQDGCPFGHGPYEWIDGRPICPVCVQQAKEAMERYMGTPMNDINGALELLRSAGYHVYDTETLKRITNNARAYGWEIGLRQIDPCAQVTTSRQNPFVKPDWDAEIIEEANAFIVTAKDVPL